MFYKIKSGRLRSEPVATERSFFARASESSRRHAKTFLETFACNAVVFAATTFFWGVPGVTIFRDVEWYDGSSVAASVGTAFWLVAIGVVFYSWALIPQVAVYSLVLTIWPRRLWAVVFAPIAVGILFTFALGPGPAAFLAAMTLSFGLSAYVPGKTAWWQDRPLRVVAVAAIFALISGAAGISQKLPGSDRTALTVTVTHNGQRAVFGLDCQYDQAGRVRSSKPRRTGIPPHPDGTRACQVLKSVEDTIAEHRQFLALNSCASQDVPFARISGVYRNHRVGELTVWRADCLETYFVRDEPFVLVPPL